MGRLSSDGRLVARARGGDAKAADELAARHVRRAWRTAYAITGRGDMADEAVQDGFERAFAALGRFDTSLPFGPWLCRIVANRALTLVSRARTTVEFDEADHPVDDGDRRDDLRELSEALARLDPDRRAVVVMRLVAGFTPEETADALGVPVGTVHSRLHRALAQMRVTLEVRAR